MLLEVSPSSNQYTCDTHHCYGRFIQLGPGVHFPKLPGIFRARKVFFSVSTILGNLCTVGKHTYRSCKVFQFFYLKVIKNHISANELCVVKNVFWDRNVFGSVKKETTRLVPRLIRFSRISCH